MDTDLPASGKDCTVILTYDGGVVGVAELVEVSVEKVVTTIKSAPLGTTNTLIATEFGGWRIKLSLDNSRPDAAEFVDLVTSGEVLRVPALIGLTVKRAYRNTQKKAHLYVDLKLTSHSERSRRGEADRVELTLETGQNRIAA